MTITFRQLVKQAVGDWLKATEEPSKLNTDQLARALKDRMEGAGYAVHDKARCVRPRGNPAELGRPMTDEEATAVGYQATETTTPQGSSARYRERRYKHLPAGGDAGPAGPVQRSAGEDGRHGPGVSDPAPAQRRRRPRAG